MKKIISVTGIFIVVILIITNVWSNNCNNKINVNYVIPNHPICKSAYHFAEQETWIYDARYYQIPYPNGDVPSGGACTDVVIRVLRKNGINLQQLIHEDMSENFSAYPKKWGLSKPDPNIDHRRVPNIMKYFQRKGYALPISNNSSDYKPGDIVTWELSPGVTHIGILMNNLDVFHNMGPTSRIESNFLFSHKIIGHYRILSVL